MIHKRLRYLRKKTGMSMRELAEAIGIGVSAYSGYENEGKNPPLHKLAQIADFHEVSVDYIIGVTDDPTRHREEINAYDYLSRKRLHWNGVPLKEEDLQPVREILAHIAQHRLRELQWETDHGPQGEGNAETKERNMEKNTTSSNEKFEEMSPL